MKDKKTLIAFLVAIALLLLAVIAFVVWVFPTNMGPIEPFLNFGDLFVRYDGTSPGKPAYYQVSPDCSTGELVKEGELIQPDFGCDSWQLNRFERPFNNLSQDEYYPDVVESDGSIVDKETGEVLEVNANKKSESKKAAFKQKESDKEVEDDISNVDAEVREDIENQEKEQEPVESII